MVTREVICQKMAPILDPVNFFWVLILLGHCLGKKVYHYKGPIMDFDFIYERGGVLWKKLNRIYVEKRIGFVYCNVMPSMIA